MTQAEVVEQAIFFALFRVVEIEELSGAEDAVNWARGVVEDDSLRKAFGAEIVRQVVPHEGPAAPEDQ
jgi:hypothetical protein